jgi:hypothetical protein
MDRLAELAEILELDLEPIKEELREALTDEG